EKNLNMPPCCPKSRLKRLIFSVVLSILYTFTFFDYQKGAWLKTCTSDWSIHVINQRFYQTQLVLCFPLHQFTRKKGFYITFYESVYGPSFPSSPGDSGFPGFPGQKGLAGPSGPVGTSVIGAIGQRGAPGNMGPPGQLGFPGQMTPPLPRGKKGNRGLLGAPGFPGLTGPDGLKGDKGQSGLLGPPGRQGCKGATGPLGDTNVVSIKGEQGKLGPPGIYGFPGPRGKNCYHRDLCKGMTQHRKWQGHDVFRLEVHCCVQVLCENWKHLLSYMLYRKTMIRFMNQLKSGWGS
uniref:Collagen IV NC1 domain-containing protein n=1 Tax=Labrus bergylta TaxID=56723 RepID=A0A3Q3EVX7_9LABR